MKKLFAILVIEFICAMPGNKHNAPTEIHTFFEGTRSMVAALCGAVKNGANDPPRPTTQPFYGSEQRLCTLFYVTLKDRFTSIQELGFFSTTQNLSVFIQIIYLHLISKFCQRLICTLMLCNNRFFGSP